MDATAACFGRAAVWNPAEETGGQPMTRASGDFHRSLLERLPFGITVWRLENARDDRSLQASEFRTSPGGRDGNITAPIGARGATATASPLK